MKNYTFLKKILLATFLALTSSLSFGQVTIWSEDFSDDTGFGDRNNTYTAPANWSIVWADPSPNSTDWIRVIGNPGTRLEWCDTDNFGNWETEEIDLTGYTNVSIDIDAAEVTNYSSQDIEVYYLIKTGGTWGTEILLGKNNAGSITLGAGASRVGSTYSVSGLVGQSLQIVCKGRATNSSGKVAIANVLVKGELAATGESNIVTAGNEMSNIPYINFQADPITTTAGGALTWTFTLQDGGDDLTDADSDPTTITDFKITKGTSDAVTSWANTIRKAALFTSGGTLIQEVTVVGEEIVFAGLTGLTALDDASANFHLYLTFTTDAIDNEQFEFQIEATETTEAATGSSGLELFTTNSSIAGDDNRLEVTATAIDFTTNPSDTEINAVMSNFIVSGVDVNGNIDLDFTGSVAITSTGSTTAGTTPTSSVTGSATFNDFVHDVIGTYNYTATCVGYSDATSSDFEIYSVPLEYDIDTYNGQTITICNGTFTDPGGSGGNYSNVAANKSMTFEPSSSGDGICLEFTEWNLDYSTIASVNSQLRFYDGSSIGADLILWATGDWDNSGGTPAFVGPGMVCSSGGPLTIEWDPKGSDQGWVANISCFEAPPTGDDLCNATAVASVLEIDCPGDAVTLTATGAVANIPFLNDFNDSEIGDGWTATLTPDWSNPCKTNGIYDGSTHFWVGNNPTRSLETDQMDFSEGGFVQFDFVFSNQAGSSPCEGPDLTDEGVYFQYSTNGSTWTTIEYFYPSHTDYVNYAVEGSTHWFSWNDWYFNIPDAAKSATTSFRWYQADFTSDTHDTWGLDNIRFVSEAEAPTPDYNWDNGAGSGASRTVYPTESTTYELTVTDGITSCTDDVTVVVKHNFSWSGTTDTDWCNVNNWSCGSVPTATSNVTIPTGCPNYPYITCAAECNNLTIEAGGSVEVGPNSVATPSSLTVSGTLTNDAGTTALVIHADATGTGSIMSNSTSVDATVETHFEAATGTQWHYLTPTTTGSNEAAYSSQSFYYWNASMEWLGMTGGVAGGIDYAPWILNSNAALVPSKGYISYNTTNTTSSQGTLYTGTFVQTLEKELTGTEADQGWNLVGNPYPCALDWDEVVDDNAGIEATMYLFDDDVQDGYQVNYRYYVASGSASGVGTADASQYAPVGQGFMVKALSNGATFTVEDDQKAHSTQEYYRSPANNPLIRIKASSASNSKLSDELILRFAHGSTPNFDAGFDARKRFPGHDQIPFIYSKEQDGNVKMAISTFPQIERNMHIPFDLNYKPGTFTISCTESKYVDAHHTFIYDALSQEYQPFNQNSSYTFTTETGIELDRFFIVFLNNNAPVQSINIQKQNALEDYNFFLEIDHETFVDDDLFDEVNYTANTPYWLNFDEENLTFHGNPDNEDVGEHIITIIATDKLGASTSTNIIFEVINTNDAPVQNIFIQDYTVYSGNTSEVYLDQGIFTDEDEEDILEIGIKCLSSTTLPGWLAFDNESLLITSNPTDEHVGEWLFGVSATDLAGEIVWQEFSITVLQGELVAGSIVKDELSIYPNPSTGKFNLNLGDYNGSYKYKVTNSIGSIILAEESSIPNKVIDLSSFTAGVYFISVVIEGQTIRRKKIIIQH